MASYVTATSLRTGPCLSYSSGCLQYHLWVTDKVGTPYILVKLKSRCSTNPKVISTPFAQMYFCASHVCSAQDNLKSPELELCENGRVCPGPLEEPMLSRLSSQFLYIV